MWSTMAAYSIHPALQLGARLVLKNDVQWTVWADGTKASNIINKYLSRSNEQSTSSHFWRMEGKLTVS